MKIKNDYLTSNLNDENMSFVYTFSKLINIEEKSFIKSMKSFKGLSHRFEIFLKRKKLLLLTTPKQPHLLLQSQPYVVLITFIGY